jgi:hypothetical protein
MLEFTGLRAPRMCVEYFCARQYRLHLGPSLHGPTQAVCVCILKRQTISNDRKNICKYPRLDIQYLQIYVQCTIAQ